MKQSNKKVKDYGVEFQYIPRKDRGKYMAIGANLRSDLSSHERYTECYELKDGSILEIFIYDFPKESMLLLFKNENDYKLMIHNLILKQEENRKYNGKTTFEIINFKQAEIHTIEKTHNRILADSLKIDIRNLDYSKKSLKLFNDRFMRITNSEEYDDNPLYKSFLYYMAIMLQKHLKDAQIKPEIQDGIVQRLNVTDRENKSYSAEVDIFEVWTEGPTVTLEFTKDSKKKKAKLTLETLFDVEIGKYKHAFPSKTSNIFGQ